jgi:hypothetical protein
MIVNFNIEDDQRVKLQRVAKVMGKSMSAVIRVLIDKLPDPANEAGVREALWKPADDLIGFGTSSGSRGQG